MEDLPLKSQEMPSSVTVVDFFSAEIGRAAAAG
jgi:hypothetical protein